MEVRWPFRDRRLVEFILGIPAHQLYRPGESKRIMRRAMKGYLPDEIRLRRRPTSLQALFDRGLAGRGLQALASVLWSPGALWRRFVDADWMSEVVLGRLRTGTNGAESLVPWQGAVVELWKRR
jgi:asparagine synthase (glutamine-hydrolysing)